jgi:glycosyltransferase involved in cell wall biosynthesis
VSEQNKLPKISVVTPSFNKAQFLEQCITSVLDQNYTNLEYFILDGGSTDGSIDIIKKYEEYITFWVSEQDEGQSDAINKGFRRATGEVVAWINADDFFLPDAFGLVAEAYISNPDASFYFGDGLRVDASGQELSTFFPDGRVVFNRTALVFGLNYILQPSAFINRTHLLEIKFLDSGLQYVMDADLWIRLSRVARPMPIPACLAASREYGDTKTATGSFPRIEELRQTVEKHSGSPMTPGVLCYFLHTLDGLVKERPDVFPESFVGQGEDLLAAAANLMAAYGARPDGFPLVTDEQLASGRPPSGSNPMQTAAKIAHMLGLRR